jgi:hypothetical protein
MLQKCVVIREWCDTRQHRLWCSLRCCGLRSGLRCSRCPKSASLSYNKAPICFIPRQSRGTYDHILLSQIRDFPFRRLLRLAGSRWRYLTPTSTRERLCQVKKSKLYYDRRSVSQSVLE